MKKIVLFGLVCAMGVASSANAGWFTDMFSKQAEPTTLDEACNSDDVATICPETLLGDKTVTECLSENVKSLSRKCAKFVKKSIRESKNKVLENKEAAADAVSGQVQTAKNAVAETKTAKENVKKSFKEKKAQLKADAKAAGKEIKDTSKAVAADAVETGQSVKEILK